MKNKINYILVILLIFFTSFCIKNKSKPNQLRVNAIVGDCFNDSLLPIIKLKMKKLGWEYKDTLKLIRNNSGYFKIITKFINDYNRKIKVISLWSIEINKNKFIAQNHWFEEYGWGPQGYNTLTTDKQDTSFWNIINIFKQYCDVRDTSYIIDITSNKELIK